MSFPPEDVSPEDLFKYLLERPAPADVIAWPGKDRAFNVRIEVQRQEEIDNCRKRADKWAKDGGADAQAQQGLLMKEILADRVACELLAVSVKYTKPIKGSEENGQIRYPRIFQSADAVRQALFSDEVTVLWDAYRLAQFKYGPTEETVTTAEERNAWVKKLAKGGDASPFLRLALPQQLAMTASLAAEKLLLSGVLRSLSASLPECWTSALARLPFDIFSSGWPAVSCTPEDGLKVDWESIPEPELPPIDRSYIDVREIAQDMLREARLAELTPED